MVGFCKQIVYLGCSTEAERKEDVKEGMISPFKTHKAPIIGVDSNVPECSFQIGLVQEGTLSDHTNPINSFPNSFIDRCPKFNWDGIIEGVVARPGKMVDSTALHGVFFGDGTERGQEHQGSSRGIRHVNYPTQ
jgi:hypothetical protein